VNRDTYTSITLLHGALSILALDVSRDEAFTTSMGNLFQCLTTLTVINFFS